MKKLLFILICVSFLYADTVYKKAYDDARQLKEYYNKRFKIQDDKNSTITLTIKSDGYLYILYEAEESGLRVSFNDKVLDR